MTRFLLLYVAVALVLFPLDALWLGVVAKNFYKAQLGDLMLDQPRLAVASLFYVVYAAGIVMFAVDPALRGVGPTGNALPAWLAAGVAGACLGVLAYGTYDVTNYATIKGFPGMVAIVDVIWGMVLTGVSAAAGTLIATRLFGVASAS